MLRGLTVSALIHASVLAMAVMSWPEPKSECAREIERLRREQPGISAIEIVMRLPQCASSSELPIDFVEIGRLSDVSEMRRSETPQPEVQAALPPEPERPPPPPPPPPPPEPEISVPDPRQPQPQRLPEPKAEPPPRQQPPPRQRPPQRQPEPKAKNDLDFLDDFESALRDRRQQPPQTRSTQEPSQQVNNADRDRAGAGNRTASTASLEAALRRQIMECWRGVDELPPDHQIDVKVRVQLNRDGSLARPVEPLSPQRRPVGRSGIAWDRALMAVRECGELGRYRLPADDYELWKDIEVTLGPRQS